VERCHLQLVLTEQTNETFISKSERNDHLVNRSFFV